MIISNSSPLIALSRIKRLDIFKEIFGKIYIPLAVYQETTEDIGVPIIQREAILKAINDGFIETLEPVVIYSFKRKLGVGEKAVLRLAIEKNPERIIIDDSNARSEAKELGFESKLTLTTDIIRFAEEKRLIDSYSDLILQLHSLNVFLPE